LGFFRFVADYEHPIDALEAALASHGDVEGSLIVLPEGFNIRKPYRSQVKCNYDPGILSDLQNLSTCNAVTFVSGLIIKERHESGLPYNSAYLIDGGCPTRICTKGTSDDGSSLYKPWVMDVENPIVRADSAIAAVICRDIQDNQRFREIEQRLAEIDVAQKILCIPACMSHHFSGEAIMRHLAPGQFLILANSDYFGCPSIVGKDGTVLAKTDATDGNRVALWDVADS
jgi:hypothetical protein